MLYQNLRVAKVEIHLFTEAGHSAGHFFLDVKDKSSVVLDESLLQQARIEQLRNNRNSYYQCLHETDEELRRLGATK